MCYDRHNHQFVLFGGGNIQSQRGDPGTWTYSPANNNWTPLKLASSTAAARPTPGSSTTRSTRRSSSSAATSSTDCSPTPGSSTSSRRPGRNANRHVPWPRAGHALLWLPRAKKILLVGGYTYTSAVGYVPRSTNDCRSMPGLRCGSERLGAGQAFRHGKDLPDGPANVFSARAVDEQDQRAGRAQECLALPFDAERAGCRNGAQARFQAGRRDRANRVPRPAWFKACRRPIRPRSRKI